MINNADNFILLNLICSYSKYIGYISVVYNIFVIIIYYYFHLRSYLVVTKTHLMALCETENKDFARVTVNRNLASILKITCKKKHPELVTFQYGVSSEVTDMDR